MTDPNIISLSLSPCDWNHFEKAKKKKKNDGNYNTN